jgi:hypothetical protein
MPRKRIAESEPALSMEGAAAAPAKAPAATKAAPNKARAPRSSATAVTHRHKKTQTVDIHAPQVPVEETAAVSAASVASTELTTSIVVTVPAVRPTSAIPTYEEIAFRAYLLAESRGFSNGSPDADWLEAEQQLYRERGLR